MIRMLAILAVALALDAAAQPYPNKPIRMIIPLAAASAVDNAARIVTQKMSANMGQPIVIENQPGAAGLIGTERVAKAAPDGYTLGGFNDSIMTMLPNMGTPMSWDILRDFEPVSLVATIEWGLVVNNESPFKSAADLIAAAKARPGEINYGSGGNGSPQHIAMALFASTAGIRLTHVPYKGASQAALGVAAGDVPVAFQGLATVAGLARGGKLRLIGLATPAPLPQFPGVPTVSDSGLPGFEFNSWFTVMAPVGTPKEIVARLHQEIQKALSDPEVRAKLLDQGLTVRGTSPGQLGIATREQLARYAKLIREAGIKAD
ncbi:MAG TPA: tripartite tricarboxylate transporter substrate-binding protein [Usitatibacter sp.]|jgi:tripartite-type tricarboxylate transporter receptor subunit TctC|nr:tripartite tricarboxylate transporter substrate-binding protein [Usitatibacter sp.]